MSLEAVIAHHVWKLGGETRVNLDLARALNEDGFRVSAVSVSKPHPQVLAEMKNYVERVYYLIPIYLPAAALLQRPLLSAALSRFIKKTSPDVVWVDSPSYRSIASGSRGHLLVEYIHFPLEAMYLALQGKLDSKLGSEVYPYFRKYTSSPLWRLYARLALRITLAVARRNPFEEADLVVANSRFTARLIEEIWGEKPELLHPPVNIDDFKMSGRIPGFSERDYSVLMIGRISPEKNHDMVIEALSKLSRPPKLRIVGALSPSARSYRYRIERLAERLGVELELHVNAPRTTLVRLALSSKVFVHATIGEHFGIAVIEAMAAGLPVVVHRSGGPFYDIIEEGRFGLAFNDTEELASSIEALLSDEHLWNRYHRLSLERAQNYTYARFREKLQHLLGKLSYGRRGL